MKPGDKIFLWTVCLLAFAGIFILISASIGLLVKKGPDFYETIFGQLGFGIGLGSVFFLITSKVKYSIWKKLALPIFLLSFLATAIVLLPNIGVSHGGAKRWIDIGLISFQPSELLKLGFVIYLSAWMVARKSDIKSFKFGFIPFAVIISFISALLILEPDIGSLGVIIIASMGMFFLGGGKLKQIGILMLVGLIIFFILVQIEPYRMNRIITFFDPSFDAKGISYQLRQSLIAIGNGGIFGRGFGMSVQKFSYLPEPIGDSIFSVFAEEFGFVGCFFLLALFLFFTYRGFYIASRAPDDFGRLLGAGIVILIIGGVFINIGSMVGILPLTGVPLLFVSKGGSALMMVLAEAGILYNISKYKKQ